jgi:hypothetical protein
MSKTHRLILLVLIVFKTGILSAQNLLSNGTFDANLDGWDNSFVTSEWVADDGAPISGNGSMKFTGSQNNNGVFGMNSSPVFIEPGYWYLTAASFKTPAASVSERGLFYIEWYDGSDVMIMRDSVDGGYGVDDDVWLPLDGFFKAPENADYMVMRLMLQSGIPGVDVDLPFGLWDDAVVMQETVFMGDFD